MRTLHLHVASACLEGYQSRKENIKVGNLDSKKSFKWDENEDMRVIRASRRSMLWLECRKKNGVEEAGDASFPF